MSECLCDSYQKYQKIKQLFKDPIKWYEKNKEDEDLVYDEAYIEFNMLSRGHYNEFLKILCED